MNAAQSFRASARQFNQLAAATRQANWPAQITLTTGGQRICCAKTPTQKQRVPQEQGAGWVQEARATFLFSATGAFVPEIGVTFTLAVYEDAPHEVGTQWRCRELKAAGVGHEHRAVCVRLD